ncbi:DUF6086 family protein [Polymorphospora sp. NPDC051019]|uniref:DUF6086 family protein n=1 Tax=Polymorphospora sp. NPDC051019 TaxID=3155725 RepID=UPI00344983AB
MSRSFQTTDGKTLWNPSNSMAALFAGTAQTLAQITATPSGIAPPHQDEYVVDLEQFVVFVAAVTRWFDASRHDCRWALAAGWLCVARAKFLGETPLPGYTNIQVIDHNHPRPAVDHTARLTDYVRAFLTWEPQRWPTDPFGAEFLADYIDTAHTRLREGSSDYIPTFFGGGYDIDLRGAVLDGMPLDDAWLGDCNLEGVSLRDTRLYKANLTQGRLDRADLTGAFLRKADLYKVSARGTILRAADLRNISSFDADLRDADLSGAALHLATLNGADLRGASLHAARFDNGWISLDGAKIAGARFDGAIGCIWGPCDVSDTDNPHLLDGPELEQWFTDNHPDAQVTIRRTPRQSHAGTSAPQP